MKVNGSVAWGETSRRGRLNADPPEVLIYADGRAVFKYYATRFLALTTVNDPEILEKVRSAAERLAASPDAPWTQEDAESLLEAGGMPPAPSHAQVAPLPGQSLLLVRAATPKAKNVRTLSYAHGSVRPILSIRHHLKKEGIKVPPGTCLKVPVKLMEDEGNLVLAVLWRHSEARSLQEVDKEDTSV